MITSAYVGIILSKALHSTFIYYLLYSYDILKVFYWQGGSVRQSMGFGEIKTLPLLYPKLKIQQQIATYLDQKTQTIDKEINLLEEKIIKYKELKQKLINETVLRGLDKRVKLKESGIEWIGKVPEHWVSIRFKQIFQKKVKKYNNLLESGSISFGKIILKDRDKIPAETRASYQEVLTGEFVINPLNLNFDLKSLRTALCHNDVVMSPGYLVLQSKKGNNKRYLRWILHQFDVSKMKTLGAGVRQTIRFDDIGNSFLYIPPYEEQNQIANYLDEKTQKIDTITETIQTKIDLLKEFKKTLINDVVIGKVKVA